MRKKFFVQFTKSDNDKREVEGYASTEALDAHGEIVEIGAIEKALNEFMEFANIREMHQPSAVGKAMSAMIDNKGLYIVAKVVDDNAWKKVKEGVYSGFSIGGRIIKQVKERIKELRLDEISLVDRPANPEARISLFKLEDTNFMPEEKKDVKKQETIVIEASEEHKKEVEENRNDVTPTSEEEKVEPKEETVEVEEKKPKKRKKMIEVSFEKSELNSLVKSIVTDALQEVQDEVKSLSDRLSKYEEAPEENKARASYAIEKSVNGDGPRTKEDLRASLLENLSKMSQEEIDSLDEKTKEALYNL